MNCFNCDAPDHASARCPHPQQFSRCPSCFSVAFTPGVHKHWCTTKAYVSRKLGNSSTVFKMQNILQIDFKGVHDEFFVRDVQHDIEVSTDLLWMSAIDTFISKPKPNSLKFISSRCMQRTINVMDKNDSVVLSLVFDNNRIVVNRRFQLSENGMITFSQRDKNGFTDHLEGCAVRVKNTDDVFKVRLGKWGNWFHFDVYPIGPILMDPLLAEAEKSIVEPHVQTAANALALASNIENLGNTIENQTQNDSNASGVTPTVQSAANATNNTIVSEIEGESTASTVAPTVAPTVESVDDGSNKMNDGPDESKSAASNAVLTIPSVAGGSNNTIESEEGGESTASTVASTVKSVADGSNNTIDSTEESE